MDNLISCYLYYLSFLWEKAESCIDHERILQREMWSSCMNKSWHVLRHYRWIFNTKLAENNTFYHQHQNTRLSLNPADFFLHMTSPSDSLLTSVGTQALLEIQHVTQEGQRPISKPWSVSDTSRLWVITVSLRSGPVTSVYGHESQLSGTWYAKESWPV